MTARIFVHIVSRLKEWLSRLARSSARLLFFFLSLLRRGLAAKLGGPIVPKSPGDIAEENLSIGSGLLPSELDATAEHLSPSDDPYAGASRPLCGGTAGSSSGNNSTIEAHASIAETDGARLHSASSSRLSLQPGESSVDHGTLGTASVPSDVPIRALAIPDPIIGDHVHYYVPPDPEGVIRYPGPSVNRLVADEIGQYRSLRYQTKSSVPPQTTVPAMTFKFPMHDAPPGWIMLVHPEGFRYFVNQENRTFTQMNICDDELYADIEYYMQYLLDELRQTVGGGSLELDIQQVDLVIEPKALDDNTVACCYYFANHCDRTLFWLDEHNIEDVLSDCKGVNLSHIGLAIEAQYWKHCDYFPYLCPVTQNLVDEVKDMLNHATCDHLNSRQSTAPFDVVELRDYLSIMDRIKVYPPTTDRSMHQPYTAVVIGRIMYTFSRNHFLNFHGESGVRMTSAQTVYPYTPSLSMIVLAPFLFLDPLTFVRELRTIFIDNMPSSERWDALNSRLNGQLQDSTLLATVLLNANVGFLAINSVDVSGRSPIQVASYTSLVASLGSMILGLLLVSHTRKIGQSTILQKAIFLSGIGDKERELERLAIVYSLPRTLLIWGMIFFFVAFSINWWSPGNWDSRAVVSFVILITILMISYGVIRTRNREDLWQTDLLGVGVRVGLKLSSHMDGAWKQVTEFVRMMMRRSRSDPTSEPRFDTEGIAMTPIPQRPAP